MGIGSGARASYFGRERFRLRRIAYGLSSASDLAPPTERGSHQATPAELTSLAEATPVEPLLASATHVGMPPQHQGASETAESEIDPSVHAAACAERDESREALLRLRAEFDNFRRRTQKEKDQIRDYTREDLLAKLLPVLDNFERAVDSAKVTTDAASIHQGIFMVAQQLSGILQAEGLRKMQAVGAAFDPLLHEALSVDERTDVPDHQVTEVLLPGYQYNEKVLRAAMVKVARHPVEAVIAGPQGGAASPAATE